MTFDIRRTPFGTSLIFSTATVLLGCGAALQEPETRTSLTCFVDEEGNAKNCHPETSSTSMDWQAETVRVRCLLAAEGRYVNCRMIQGPPIVEDRVLEMLRKAQPKPVVVQGQPVDTNVLLVFRWRFRLP